MGRNWLTSLWRTSYKGAAFWVETTTEEGGRRIVIHEFPMRDTPFLEDLGERYREFTLTAYVASDKADSEAAALLSVCGTRGPGVLVLPTQGPVTVRCTNFGREFSKDRMGYEAHSLKFVREGFSGSLVSVNSLINTVFVQAEAAATAIATGYAASAALKDVPDYVQEAVQISTENALATLEYVRTSVNVEPVANALQRDVIEATYQSLNGIMAAEDSVALQAVGQTVVDVAIALTDGMDPAVALATWSGVIEATPLETVASASFGSAWAPVAARNTQAGNTLLRLAAIVSYCEAIARVPLGDRPAAITLRANVANFFEEQLGALPSEAHDLYTAMIKLRDATIDYLSRAVIDLAPVVRVSASLSMPSLYWAWRLYGDPTRSDQLVARNRTVHPSFIPPNFEALGK